MPIMFTAGGTGNPENRGRVVALGNAQGGSILQVEGWGGFEGFKAIFTRVGIAEQTHQQFQHMLGNHIYVYVFGDQIGQMTLSGLAFQDNCLGGNKIGISHVVDYYRANRLAKRVRPLKVTIQPDTTWECFLLGLRGDTLSAEQRLFQFSMTLALIPEDLDDPGR